MSGQKHHIMLPNHVSISPNANCTGLYGSVKDFLAVQLMHNVAWNSINRVNCQVSTEETIPAEAFFSSSKKQFQLLVV